ncbi:cell division septal protein FtsQ [Algoriphagus sp. 4150]|nr:cell division septal protein FtsQ [Algoriphagus sp. 4150]
MVKEKPTLTFMFLGGLLCLLCFYVVQKNDQFPIFKFNAQGKANYNLCAFLADFVV